VRRTPVATLAAALLACAFPPGAAAARVLVLDHGRVHVREERGLGPADPIGPARPAPVPSPPTARAAAKPPGPTVRAELDRLLAAGAIDQAARDRYRAQYDAAQATLKRLHGRRLTELKAVVANLDAVSAAHGLTAGRLPLAFLTLARNRAWWTTGPLTRYGQRVAFGTSLLVWQSYPGQGLQVQWLGTFGKANALWRGGRRYDPKLRALLDEVTPLASARAGGLAFESWFRFDGGRPPWVSGLSAGTALQAYSRAAIRLRDPTLFGVARALLGIFRTAPPEGVRLAAPAGPHYLIYSFAPKVHVLNAFVQALNGLYDFGALANDPEGRALMAQGDAEARRELPHFDTGAWSRYSWPGRESDLGYHELLRGFLEGLCEREHAAAAAPPPPGLPALDPAPYCAQAARYARYEHEPPALALLAARPARPRPRRAVRVPYTLSKVSAVTTLVTRGGRAVAGRTVRLARGRHTLRFTPRAPGAYAVAVRAVDLAGNAARVSGAVRVGR
jgi:hypothetical protein